MRFFFILWTVGIKTDGIKWSVINSSWFFLIFLRIQNVPRKNVLVALKRADYFWLLWKKRVKYFTIVKMNTIHPNAGSQHLHLCISTSLLFHNIFDGSNSVSHLNHRYPRETFYKFFLTISIKTIKRIEIQEFCGSKYWAIPSRPAFRKLIQVICYNSDVMWSSTVLKNNFVSV